jgi:Uma2 family endonuclease
MSTVTRVTIAEYDRMIANGLFEPGEQHHVELIHGEIREMSPIGSPHEVVLDHLAEWSFIGLPKGKVWVRVQNSIGIPELDSAPQPDLAWVARRDYSRGRPVGEDVLLIVEVSDSSLRFDLSEKADLYAAAAISDYWVVNVSAHTIVVHRDPADGHYRTVQTYRESDELRPLRIPEVVLRPAAIWQGS